MAIGLLDALVLMPPPSALEDTGIPVPQRGHLPVFCTSLPWHELSVDVARLVAKCLMSRGILVSFLQSDLDVGAYESLSGDEFPRQQRLVPLRNERYGTCRADLDFASLVDWQLTPTRDDVGRYAYGPERLARWEKLPEGHQPPSGGGWVPTMMSPADVVEHQLQRKVQQLRQLTDEAKVLVSFGVSSLSTWLEAAIDSQCDGVLIRFDEIACDGLQFASFLADVLRRFESRSGQSNKPELWVTPPQHEQSSFNADDIAKLLAMGVASVGIDYLLRDAYQELAEIPPPSQYHSQPAAQLQMSVNRILEQHIDRPLLRLDGLRSTLLLSQPRALLSSLHPEWSNRLGIGLIEVPRI